ncbi:MAG: histidine phosphatase family protein [Clostridiales bacterium]|nr:histidine phosphatase family protein [Clostridia bacterium]MCR4882680.1 histidine phosphatase family protein [Clostridiales bacterium]
MIVRHAEPDYSIDALTPKGRVEAELLASRLSQVPDVLDYYISPLGRAIATAGYTLQKVGRKAEILPWLCEFRGACFDPDHGVVRNCWDYMPRLFHGHPELEDADRWLSYPFFKDSNVKTIWKETTDGVDALMAKYGYQRDGSIWRAEHNQQGVIVLFCHFGIAMAVMGYLTHMSPMVLWQNFCMVPSSVTTLISEERIPHEVSWRCIQLGDISHLTGAGESYSTAGLFPECYTGRDSTDPPAWGDRHHP